MMTSPGGRRVGAVVIVGVLGGCCFGSSPAAAPAGPPSIVLAPGFAPQPTTQRGNAYGSFVNALDFGVACRGLVPSEPQHVIEVTAEIPALTVAVNGRGASDAVFDPTLVIRTPDGRSLCDDDSEGRDPRVRAPFPPGRYEVYVGSYGSLSIPSDGDYTLGVTEADVMPSAIPEPS